MCGPYRVCVSFQLQRISASVSPSRELALLFKYRNPIVQCTRRKDASQIPKTFIGNFQRAPRRALRERNAWISPRWGVGYEWGTDKWGMGVCSGRRPSGRRWGMGVCRPGNTPARGGYGRYEAIQPDFAPETGARRRNFRPQCITSDDFPRLEPPPSMMAKPIAESPRSEISKSEYVGPRDIMPGHRKRPI